jgi:WhiB family redox-sensing transcriptional regulator
VTGRRPPLLRLSEGDDWRQRAACARPGIDPEWFFPEPGHQGKRAKRICARCPVRDACLAAALAIPEAEDHGVRGGLTARERLRLRRQLAGRAR